MIGGWTGFHLMGFKLCKNLYLGASTRKFLKNGQTKVEIIMGAIIKKAGKIWEQFPNKGNIAKYLQNKGWCKKNLTKLASQFLLHFSGYKLATKLNHISLERWIP